MICDKISKPDMPRTKALIKAECRYCKFASKELKWCGLFGEQLTVDEASVIVKGKHLLKDVSAVIRSGAKKRNDKEQKRILEICRNCRFYRTADSSCSKCGCDLKRKIKFEVTKCPAGEW